MPKIDIDKIPVKTGSGYPGRLAAEMNGRTQTPLSGAGNLTQFGVNIVTLPPGALSSLRHWHEEQDEFLIMLEGTLTLVEDDHETPLQTGDCAAFPAGVENGHHLINNSSSESRFLVVGTNTDTETAWYSDLDMKVKVENGNFHFTRKNGSDVEL